MRNFKVDVIGKVVNYDLPLKNSVMAILEAVINSIHSILDRLEEDDKYKTGHIKIKIKRESDNLIDKNISCIIIEDDGLGFTNKNMDSFLTIESRQKVKYGGKGVGRFSWLKVFSNVEVDSVYSENNIKNNRKFEFSQNNHIEDVVTENIKSKQKTIVKLINPYPEVLPYINKPLESLAKIISKHALFYLVSNPMIDVTISDEEKNISINDLISKNIIETNKNSFIVKNEEFFVSHYKISKELIDHNEVLLYADNRFVESYYLDKLIPILSGWSFDNFKNYYVALVSGNYLDANVQSNRLGFNIIQETGDLDTNPSMDNIRDGVSTQIMEYLKNDIQKIRKEIHDYVIHYINTKRPEYSVIKQYAADELRDLKPNLKGDKLDEELYKIYRGLERESRNNIKKLLEKKPIFGKDYKKIFLKEFSMIDDLGKSNLAKYITYRKIIIDLMETALKRGEVGYSKEDVIHNIIFPMKATNQQYGPNSHNLWLIDDRLSYMSYISSDKAIINRKDRPDLLCMDVPGAFKLDSNNNINDTLTIIELKRPMRNDNSKSRNPMDQMLEYVSEIRVGNAETHEGRPILVDENTRFYLYAICDIDKSLRKIIQRDDYKQLPDKLGYYKYHNGYNAYIEIIPFDKLVNDARVRNRIFIETLKGLVSFDDI